MCMGEIVNSSTENFLKQMHIDVESVIRKLGSTDVKPSAKEIESYIGAVGENFLKGVATPDLQAIIQNEFISRKPKMTTAVATDVLDSIRHALNSFISGGVKELYFYQENEAWYPKVVIASTIDVSEIINYPDLITVYRGCSNQELESGTFKQSWSTSIDVAREFAFSHYAQEQWFTKDERVIVKAIIPKQGVYLTRIAHHEREVIVNTELLSSIEKCT